MVQQYAAVITKTKSQNIIYRMVPFESWNQLNKNTCLQEYNTDTIKYIENKGINRIVRTVEGGGNMEGIID